MSFFSANPEPLASVDSSPVIQPENIVPALPEEGGTSDPAGVLQPDEATGLPYPAPRGEPEAKPSPKTQAMESKSDSELSVSVKAQTVQGWIVREEFDWLCYQKTQDGLYVPHQKIWCGICNEVYREKSNKAAIHDGQAQVCDLEAYLTGTTIIKKNNVKSHNTSKSHVNAVQIKEAKKKAIRKEQLQKMGAAAQHRMEKLFDWAYCFAKLELPFTVFPDLITMEEKHGSDLGSKYRNDKACHDFVVAIGDVFREDLCSLFSQKPFYFSLLCDGSTDKTLSEKEIISIKVVEKGEAQIKVLGISEPTSCKADDICKAIKTKCQALDLPMKSSMIGMAGPLSILERRVAS